VRLFLKSAAHCLALALALAFPLAGAAEEEKVTLNFVNADLQSVIKTVGQHTGKNFILDPRVTGTVNIVSQTPVGKDLLYPILLSVLRTQGFAAVEGNGFIKIVPESEAKTSNSPMGADAARVPGDKIVTRVFVLQNESALQLVPVLRPLVTANNFIAAYASGNAIVITDYAENVKRIEKIIQSIDLPSGSEVQLIKLNNASAVDVAATLNKVISEVTPPANSPGAQAKAIIAVDTRTNSLIVRADSPAVVNRIRGVVATLDAPGAASGNIYVVFLRNAEATRIADMLRGLLAGSSGASAGSTTGASPPSGTTQPMNANTGANQPGTSALNTQAPPAAPASAIQAFPSTNSLIITATEPVYRSLRAVIDKLDVRRAQVLVEALILEVSIGKGSEFGVQFQGFQGLNHSGVQAIGGTNFSNSPQFNSNQGTNIIGLAQNLTSIGTGLNLGIINGRITIPGTDIEILNLNMLARALEADLGTNILATPNVLTLDNEEARLLVGQNVPFLTGSYTTSASVQTNPFQTIERKDIGLTLRVKPQITEAGTVKLTVFQELSSISRDTTVKSSDLIVNKRSLESTVLVDDGQIIVLGGLIQDDQIASVDKVPLLGDIPWIGSLFKYESRSHNKTNLMVFLRPFVMRDGDAARALTSERYDYIRNEQGKMNLPRNVLLPPVTADQLPPLDNRGRPPTMVLPVPAPQPAEPQ
jgi:general secretion pathway protein D